MTAGVSSGALLDGRFVLGEALAGEPPTRAFVAHDTVLARPIEVRLASPDPAQRSRFLRQLRAHSKLHHPGVRHLHQAGMHEGVPFMVLERVDGPTLSEELERGRRFSERELVGLGLRVLEAVGAVHDLGIVHGRLACEGIALVGGDLAAPKLLDVGAAFPMGHFAGELIEASADVQGTAVVLARLAAEDWPDGLSLDVRETLAIALGATMQPPPTASAFHGMLRDLYEAIAGRSHRRPKVGGAEEEGEDED